MRSVALFVAPGCALCGEALVVVEAVASDLGLAFDVVDISLDPGLEERYRERIPVVEIDGEAAFWYFVDAPALRAALS